MPVTIMNGGRVFTARITFAAGGELSGVLTPFGGEATPVSGSWKLKGNRLCRTLAPIQPDEICEAWFKAGRNRATVLANRKFASTSGSARNFHPTFAFSSTRNQFSPVILRTFSGVVMRLSDATRSP